MTRTIVALVALTITVHVGICDEAQDLARNRLLHVSVEGVAASDSSTTSPPTTQLAGKAFAIAPGVLVTAAHVVEDLRFWRNKGTPGGVAVPDREVTVSWMSDYEMGAEPKSSSEFYVTSSAVGTADVAILVVPQSVRATLEPFPLSAEPIDKAKDKYRVLLVRDQPSSSDSIEKPEIVPLNPVQHSHLYQGLYVFDTDGAREIRSGDSGSPVLDDENRVVGLISGRTEKGHALVTLASSLERSSLMLHQRIEQQAARITKQEARIDELTTHIRTLQSALDNLPASVQVVKARIVVHTPWDIPAAWKNLTQFPVPSVPDPERTFVIDRDTIGCKQGYVPVTAWTEITGSFPNINVMYTVDASVRNGEVTIRARARKGEGGYAYYDVLLLCRPE